MEASELADPATTDDLFLGGRLRLLQPARGHRSGHDALLLAATVPTQARGSLVELGAGVGAAGLSAAVRARDIAVTLVEIDERLVDLAVENARRNGLQERVNAIRLDVAAGAAERAKAGLPAECADMVICNPPFYRRDRERASPELGRAQAHHEGAADLEIWLRAAVATVRQGGRVTLIHRPDALPRLFSGLEGRVGALSLRPILPRPEALAIRILVSGIRGSRAPLSILPPLALEDGSGDPSAAAQTLLRGEAELAVA